MVRIQRDGGSARVTPAEIAHWAKDKVLLRRCEVNFSHALYIVPEYYLRWEQTFAVEADRLEEFRIHAKSRTSIKHPVCYYDICLNELPSWTINTFDSMATFVISATADNDQCLNEAMFGGV